jgi:hypothetical protein
MAVGRPEDTQRRRRFRSPDSQEFGSLARVSRKSRDFHDGDVAANKSATALPEGVRQSGRIPWVVGEAPTTQGYGAKRLQRNECPRPIYFYGFQTGNPARNREI